MYYTALLPAFNTPLGPLVLGNGINFIINARTFADSYSYMSLRLLEEFRCLIPEKLHLEGNNLEKVARKEH